MGIYLNSYYPISHTDFGKQAVSNFGIHPLEDGSIRREPDFGHPLAPISGLCRPGSMKGFKPGDIVIYKTNSTHLLTAVLEISKRFDSHEEAADWLVEKSYELPSNNITAPPLPISHSHALGYMASVGKGARLDAAVHTKWNAEYIFRAINTKSSYFFITNSIYNVVQHKVNKDFIPLGDFLKEQIGEIPRTNWRPVELPKTTFTRLQEIVGF